MRRVAVIQARMGSSRLPGKVLRPLGDRTVLGWVVRAASHALPHSNVIVATTTASEDDAVARVAESLGVGVARGAVDDVLGRFVQATAGCGDDQTLVRLTADCPLLDPAIVRAAVQAHETLGLDYFSTINPRRLPRGLDVEVLSVGVLREVAKVATGVDRVHVTSHLYRTSRRPHAGLAFHPPADDLRVTLDTEADAQVLEAIVAELGTDPPRWIEVVELLRQRPDIVALNADVPQKSLDEG